MYAAKRVYNIAMQRGYYGIGIFEPKYAENVGTLWRHALIYGAHFVFTVGGRYQHAAGDTAKAARHVPLWQFTELGDLQAHLPEGCELIGVETKGPNTVALDEFEHPLRAAYLLGGETSGLPAEVLAQLKTIHIPTFRPISLNVAAAGTLVLHDRFTKSRRRTGKN